MGKKEPSNTTSMHLPTHLYLLPEIPFFFGAMHEPIPVLLLIYFQYLQVHSLEQLTDELKERCFNLHKGCKRFMYVSLPLFYILKYWVHIKLR
jgi:hypothetical protein